MEKPELENTLLVSKKGALATISLNKPPANSYHRDYLKLITKSIARIDRDKSIKIVLLNSTSENFFCAGADIKVFSTNTTEENREMAVAARELSATISESNKIIVAAINGHALGGGLEIAMACDIRLGSEGNYHIGLPEVKLGLMPGNGGTPGLIDLIGAGRAMEMLVTGNTISPRQAYEYGLFNRLYSEKSFEKEVNDYVSLLAKGAGKAMSAIKKTIRHHKGLSLAGLRVYEAKVVDTLYNSEDAKEGFLAFIEKRTPNFK